MIASSDQKRKIPKTYRSTTATMAMSVARPSADAARTFSIRVNTRSKRCTLLTSIRGTGMAVGHPRPVAVLPGVLFGEQVVDQVPPDDVGVLLPHRRHNAVLERLALLRG